MAGKATFHSRDSSRRRPTPRRSSETKAKEESRHLRGLFRGISFPSNSTRPPASYRPMMPLGMPSFPWPARPPIPRISPSLTSRETFRTVSPGISTHSFSILRAIFAFSPGSCSAACAVSPEAPSMSLPTIQWVIWWTSVCEAGTFSTRTPSRMTATVSQTDRISCRRWVIKMTEIPREDIPRMESSRASASRSVRTAVGSSRMRSLS